MSPDNGNMDENDELRCLISGLTMPPISQQSHKQPKQEEEGSKETSTAKIGQTAAFACSACPVTSSCKLGQSLGW